VMLPKVRLSRNLDVREGGGLRQLDTVSGTQNKKLKEERRRSSP
jgi:hypothetical protein